MTDVISSSVNLGKLLREERDMYQNQLAEMFDSLVAAIYFPQIAIWTCPFVPLPLE
jgi:hypothetical protein